jgi:hypothetical protein
MKIVKWLLFLPVAIISAILISGIYNFVIHWSVVGVFHLIVPKWKWLTDFLSGTVWFSTGLITPIVWMTVGLKTAPVANKFARWFLLIPLLIFTLSAVIGSVYFNEYVSYKHVSNFSMNPRIGQIILSVTAFIISVIIIFTKFSIEKDYDK